MASILAMFTVLASIKVMAQLWDMVEEVEGTVTVVDTITATVDTLPHTVQDTPVICPGLLVDITLLPTLQTLTREPTPVTT